MKMAAFVGGRGSLANVNPARRSACQRRTPVVACSQTGAEEAATRCVKKISRKAYAEGIVVIQCKGCQGRHIIADNLGWYSELTDGLKNIEEMAKRNGEPITRVADENIFHMENSFYNSAEAKSKSPEDNEEFAPS